MTDEEYMAKWGPWLNSCVDLRVPVTAEHIARPANQERAKNAVAYAIEDLLIPSIDVRCSVAYGCFGKRHCGLHAVNTDNPEESIYNNLWDEADRFVRDLAAGKPVEPTTITICFPKSWFREATAA